MVLTSNKMTAFLNNSCKTLPHTGLQAVEKENRKSEKYSRKNSPNFLIGLDETLLCPISLIKNVNFL